MARRERQAGEGERVVGLTPERFAALAETVRVEGAETAAPETVPAVECGHVPAELVVSPWVDRLERACACVGVDGEAVVLFRRRPDGSVTLELVDGRSFRIDVGRLTG